MMNFNLVQHDQLLLGWLLSTITTIFLSQVPAYTTSYDVWHDLQEKFLVQDQG